MCGVKEPLEAIGKGEFVRGCSLMSVLLSCYQVKDLPRTSNDLEQFFGTARHVKRRVTGRKRALPMLVVRGSVRVIAVGMSQLLSFSSTDLRLIDVTAWCARRMQLEYRHEGRRSQLRFRRDPNTPIWLCWNGVSSVLVCHLRTKTLPRKEWFGTLHISLA